MVHWANTDGHLVQALLGTSSLCSGARGAQRVRGWQGLGLAGSCHPGDLASMEVTRGSGLGKPSDGLERGVVS